jgi:ATP-dependent exoDNAse (exonuclease V) alpha subunit
MLAAARLAWELEGFDVHGASLSGKAAKGLSDGARIESDTLHKTLYDIEAGRLRLSDRSVLVVDEAGMVGTRQMRKLVEACEKSGARLVLVGDARQLQPIEAGGPFAEVQKQLGAAKLTQIRRQRDGWARDAVTDFAAGRANEGLTAYAERGLLSIADDRQGAYQKLIDSWKTEGARAPEEQLIFTGSRLEAAILNRMAQAERKKLGELEGEGIPAPGKKDTLYVGDRVLFTKKSRLYGVENGSLGDVVEVDAQKGTLTSRLDSGEKVTVPLAEYPQVQLGYAITTHKGQGATVERSFILVGGGMQDREVSYVQTSRARGDARLFSDKETAGHDLYQLVRQMETSRAKEMAHSVAQQLQANISEQVYERQQSSIISF